MENVNSVNIAENRPLNPIKTELLIHGCKVRLFFCKENNADSISKLMNYIRFWQASGESIKTSIRTKTRLGQIVQEGRFKGGAAPFGYKLERGERLNKKGYPLYEISIDENDAEVVKQIFDLYVERGYGSQRICNHLRNNGIYNKKGISFTNTTISHMLRNKSYLGILKSGETHSDIFPELQIIDVHTFERTQELLTARSQKAKENSRPSLNAKDNALLHGIVFCGHYRHKHEYSL